MKNSFYGATFRWGRHSCLPARADRNVCPTSSSAGSELVGKHVELNVLEVPVQFTLVQHLAVFARRLYPAVVQQEDAIAVSDGRDAVRQEDRRPARQNSAEGVVQERLSL